MKLADSATNEDDVIRRDEQQRRLQRVYGASMWKLRCATSNFAVLAAGRAVIVANFLGQASTAKHSLSVFENKARFILLTDGG